MATLSTASKTFDNQNQGTASAAQTVTLTNTGGATLNIASIVASGDFAHTTTCAATLSTAASCSISIRFAPSSVGALTGSVVVTSDAENSPNTITLSGTGLAVPVVLLDATSLSFSAAAIGTPSTVQKVRLSNTGAAALTLTHISASGDFGVTHNCGSGLGAGGFCNLSISFTPSATGTRTGDVTISSNAPGSPHSVALSGQVAQPVAVTLDLTQGWNLLGNGLDQPMAAASLFGDTSKDITVWKWDVLTSGWQFYAPSMDATTLQSYASSKGYGVLNNINAGEGFWVNAAQAFSVSPTSGNAISATAFQPGQAYALTTGWNLVAIGNATSARDFNIGLSAVPPAIGTIPANLTTLWAWDAALSQWYFYAPGLDAAGGTALFDYTASKGYLDFVATGKLLTPGVGFWMNRP